MPRGKAIPKRKIKPDPKYKSELLAKFINYIMMSGKKTVAQAIVYGALDILEQKTGKNPLKVFEEAIDKIRPQVEVRSRRVGGANYQVPMPVSGERQNALAFRWIIGASRAKSGKPMMECLATELLDIMEGNGTSIKKKEDVQRMAEANRAFAHFARR
ncbi:MAG: 30S ribosomal protein S7 [Candidatus Magasanikbacteria bacterium CG11_big_fil_rev_8_21_14_0_20_39_34]|uniref:Small ribosomal subunit protein uS7 n=1 Tax=Candidatus Magasanikbacteria bacterium CG11_big_fil_rev_8_21_14_0_20_39_34 TaxID=1974653 RepID=A0A2H0N3S3_9BACT|nr:MAG: 30S ribosomal protein S7 [Candidatus Magasanikbacteria bacterium CG11_big_fil_rev_8_21_14_0_20_39_34]